MYFFSKKFYWASLVIFVLVILFLSKNILFGKSFLDKQYGIGKRQKFDIYLPLNLSQQPLKSIILIHGGGWNSGDKSAYNTTGYYFRQRGYVVIQPNYSLKPGDGGPNKSPMDDIYKLLNFLYRNRSKWSLDVKNVSIMGHSAGGYLALMANSKQGLLRQPIKFKNVIAVSPVTNLKDSTLNKPMKKTINHLISFNPKQAINVEKINPITQVYHYETNYLLVHGLKDQIVPYQQTTTLTNKLRKNNYTVSEYLYPKAGHDIFANSFDKINFFIYLNNWFK